MTTIIDKYIIDLKKMKQQILWDLFIIERKIYVEEMKET